jgi:hypothetical protein
MTEREECRQARQNIDDTDTLAPEQSLSIEQHIRNCAECTVWRHQAKAISTAASELPMFDVPEAVTQRIISDVQNLSEKQKWTGQPWILSVITISAVSWIFAVDPLESLNGTVSWLIALVVLAGLKMIIENNTKNDAMQKHV